ncbi:MAG TPA: hypothetical protein VEC37_02750 [Bacillota bacterium]|nr:hypothetical protein [Bacillota bacterium]
MKIKILLGLTLIFMLSFANTPAWGSVDYTQYNGKWSDLSLINNKLTSYINKTLELQITPDGKVSGQIEYHQVKQTKAGLKAIAELSGKITDGRASCQFIDDWGHAGFVELEFLRHEVRAKLIITKAPKEQAAWGVINENLYFSRRTHQPLLQAPENVVFSFVIPATEQILTIGVASGETDYLICRFGKPDHYELQYPQKLLNSWKKFSYTATTRRTDGVTTLELAYLIFKDSGFIYTVYQEYQAEKDEETLGLKVENPATGKVVELNGDPATIIGSLNDLKHEKRLTHL